MKVLRIPAIGGLYHEFFDPNPCSLRTTAKVKNSILDGNGLFWGGLFQSDRIENVVNRLKDNLHANQWQIPQYRSIAANPQEFIRRAIQAPVKICSPSCGPEEFFSAQETITILCKLYSDFEFAPFQLTLQDGFLLNSESSDELYQGSLHMRTNPYLSFFDEKILPVIKAETPDIIFLEGRLDFYFAAVAMRTKLLFPDLHICLTRHSSEYYSLNKIKNLLKQNYSLFRIVDSIVLEFFGETETRIIEVLSKNESLQHVPNLLYQDSDGNIRETEFAAPSNCKQINVYVRNSGLIADIHLEPYVKCHWNQCSFCGINKKYHYEDHPSTGETLQKKILQIKSLSDTYHYIWFIDEALQPKQLCTFAQQLCSNNVDIIWQARCRANQELLENNLPELLYQSGLRELRIGLESASYAILKLMHKFEDTFRLELMESIIKAYTSIGISIHCPIILAFPQEEQGDRRKTYEFLLEMREKYPLFTFNLNILCLDISSSLYKNWAEYQIQSIHFPCKPQYFLGNWVIWMPSSIERDIDAERQTFMQEQLYPWLPVNALTPPTLLYRLSETSRRTLLWKSNGTWNQAKHFSFDMTLQIEPSLAITQEAENQYLIYCWESHHYMHGNRFLLELLDAFREPQNTTAVIKSLVSRNPAVYQYEELGNLIYKMFDYGFFVGEHLPYSGPADQKVKDTYNRIYGTETYLYELKPEKMLMENQNIFSKGEVLELGIGMGRNVPFLLKNGFHVTGVDLSDIAIRRLKEQYGTQGRFWAGDIRSFPIQPSHYTLIVCSLVLSYLDDAELSLLAERIKQGSPI